MLRTDSVTLTSLAQFCYLHCLAGKRTSVIFLLCWKGGLPPPHPFSNSILGQSVLQLLMTHFQAGLLGVDGLFVPSSTELRLCVVLWSGHHVPVPPFPVSRQVQEWPVNSRLVACVAAARHLAWAISKSHLGVRKEFPQVQIGKVVSFFPPPPRHLINLNAYIQDYYLLQLCGGWSAQ